MDKIVSTYEFKTHFSQYMAALEAGEYSRVIVQRHNKPVGIYVPYQKNEISDDLFASIDKTAETLNERLFD